MNVLSMFDGMSCGQIALNKLGIDVENYYASEIDKYAIEITQKNYPNTVQLGDVTKWESWDIDWSSIDLVNGGFPCQAWSIAGKQMGDKDPRGMLFWTMLDVMKNVLKHNPNAHFLIENVKMKGEFEEYITHHTKEALGTVYKHLFNSSSLSAQSRERYYWTNIKNITQPDNKGLVIKDILEPDCSERIPVRNVDLMTETENYWQMDSSGNGYASQQDRIRKLDKPSNTLSAGTASIPKIMVDFEEKEIPNPSSLKETKTFWQYDKNGENNRSQGSRIRKLDHPSSTLQASSSSVPKIMVKPMVTYRKLTPTECERLQTVPEGYTEGVSNTQRYKMLGNGWTVDVIAHILDHINNPKEDDFTRWFE